ncbi:WW domain protein [Cordyceps fumosorosea ARSEF 2679]|uniref:WW domain protein n=1 Tax=Cordyceps fumosorosea (strain ARSEF 2679) TaxID=1081104 RepID=A0A167PA89_CORFA|nr:WW domain protein [Cordyceps fumosorosea ARSEF 2679]OAA56451.1 WW domain protein [Cordyceps fumosorosea ARSEF 2679]
MASPAPESAAGKPERATEEKSIDAAPAVDHAARAERDDDGIAGGAETTPPAEEQEEDNEAHSSSPTQADLEDGEVEPSAADAAPPLPNEPTPPAGGPPLPSEPVPEDDGWDCQFDPRTQAWFFYNRFTGKTQWDNPRVPSAAATTAAAAAPLSPPAAAGGYNPAIHGDYDPEAWYAKGSTQEDGAEQSTLDDAAADDLYAATATFNRFSGGFQDADAAGRHTDEAKTRRQMNAYFDADAAAAAHDGRSLRAERQGKRPSKAEVKAFREKRRARKEEKRRAWLRD